MAALPLLLLPLLVACGAGQDGDRQDDGGKQDPSSAAADHDPSDEDFTAVRAVLDARAEAIVDGDEKAFLATLDDRDPDFVAQQRTVFDNLRQLPVDTMSYRMEDYGLPAADVAGDDPVLRPAATELVELDGPDLRPVANETDMTFVRRDDTWLLAAERSPEADSMTVRSRVWFGGPIAVEVRGDLVVVTDADQRKRVAGLADRVEDDLSSLAADLGVRRRSDIMVDASSNSADHEMNALGTGSSAAVTFGVGNGQRLAGHRIAVDPDLADDVARGRQALLLRHELTHFVLWDWGSPRVPLWVQEGIAEHAAAIGTPYHPEVPQDLRAELRTVRRELPSSGTFSTYPQRNYLIAVTAVDELVSQRGLDHFMRFLRAFPVDEDGDTHTARLLKKFYGTSEQQLSARVWRRMERLPTA